MYHSGTVENQRQKEIFKAIRGKKQWNKDDRELLFSM